MLKKSVVGAQLFMVAVGVSFCSSAMAEKSFYDAMTSGKFTGNARLRYESVEDDFFAEDAEALTLRSRIGYETAPFHDVTALVEYENVTTLGGMDDYQDPPPPAPSRLGYAVIADPEGSEFNRAQLKYRGIKKLNLTLGRQYITYDNQRWIGNVGFRQDDQTFDAFTAEYKGIDDVVMSYAYVMGVNGIAPEFDNKVSDHFYNISYNGWSLGKLTAYYYDLHSQNDSIRGPAGNIDVNAGLRYASNQTTGLRFDGGYNLPTTFPLRALYRAEWAQQEAHIMEPVARRHSRETTYRTEYSVVELGAAIGLGGGSYTLTPVLGYEVLGSDDSKYGLQTPYGTKHAFNGWADQFLVTPKEGLVDQYVNIGFNLNKYAIKTLFQYHDYDTARANIAQKSNLDLGDEYSVQVTKTFAPNWTLGSKYSVFNESSDAKDVLRSSKLDASKFWVWAEYNF